MAAAKLKFGRGPLHLAARSASVTAELLTQHAAAINAKDQHGFTPIYTASMFGDAVRNACLARQAHPLPQALPVISKFRFEFHPDRHVK